MAKFKYSAVTPDGTTITGVEEAESRGHARIALAHRDLDTTEIEEKRSILQFELTKKGA